MTKSFSTNRLKRHKSFSCPHLLVSDLSAPSSNNFNFRLRNANNFEDQSIQEIDENNKDIKLTVEPNSDVKNSDSGKNRLLQPLVLHRRLSISLPKDIDRFSSMSFNGRKLGTVSKPPKPYCAEEIENIENEFSPMMEKYRQ